MGRALLVLGFCGCTSTVIFLFLGCGTDELFDAPDLPAAPLTDLSFEDPPDLSVEPQFPDLSRRPFPEFDLGWNSCAGTALAGTCVAAFFDSFAACFQPAGHCDYTWFLSGGNGASWDDQARYVIGPLVPLWAPPASDPGFRESYWMGPTQCLAVRDYAATEGGPIVTKHFCRPGDHCEDGDGGPIGGAIYDLQTGIFTCPDATQVDVGANLGDCTILNVLLTPQSICDSPYW